MKRNFLFLLTVLVVIAFAMPAFAAPPAGIGWECPLWAYGEPTAEQKAQIDKMNQQLFEERKQMLEKRVEWGFITREEADRRLTILRQRMEDNPGVPLYGRGAYGGGRGPGGGPGGGCCWR